MGKSSDLEAGGGGFDSRLAEVMLGSLFREFWDVLGCVWEWSGDVFRQILEGLGKNVRWDPTIIFFKKTGEYFS